MNWIYKLERKTRWRGINHLMIYITATMFAVYLVQNLLQLPIISFIDFSVPHILRGQVWRLLTFVFVPPVTNMSIFIVFVLYFYYMIGEALENAWGSFAFTVYYLCGMVGIILAGFFSSWAMPAGAGLAVGNFYLNMSLFFAYALLYPDHQILLFFVIPIKIKYLAFLDAALFAVSFVQALLIGDWATCACVVMALLNFFLFFGPNFIDKYRNWRRYGASRRNFRKSMRDNDFWR